MRGGLPASTPAPPSPRTDAGLPAVIQAVTCPEAQQWLARGAAWPGLRALRDLPARAGHAAAPAVPFQPL